MAKEYHALFREKKVSWEREKKKKKEGGEEEYEQQPHFLAVG